VIPAGPYTLTLGQTVQIDPPSSHLQAAIVVNQSPFACAVEAIGQQIWLPGWTQRGVVTDGTASLRVTPQLALAGTPTGTNGQLLISWVQPGDPPVNMDPVSLTAQAVAGAIASLGVSDTALIGSPFLFPASTVGPGKLFPIPAGAPAFSNLLIGFETAGGGTAGLATIVVDGDTSGIHYLLATTLQRGEFITCPFSSVADPTGVRLGVTFPAGGTGTFAVIGQVNPTTVRALIGAKQLSGPTNYAHAITSGVTLIPAGASAQSIIRVWSAWVSIAHTALADGSVQLGAGGTVVLVNAQSPAGGGSDANSISHPGGVPIPTGLTAIILSAGAGSVRGGIAWSVDVT
jgi:hypothetical protein